jgi:hypothetical protein
MAQTRRRRRKKHRGTQGGSIDRRRARGRPRSREEAKAQARRRAGAKGGARAAAGVPTWRSAFNRAAIGAVIFFILAATLLEQPVTGALALSLIMLAIYVPLGYHVDRFFYRRRLLKERQARAQNR